MVIEFKNLEKIINLTLGSVKYACIKNETKMEDISNWNFYHGGEVELNFFEKEETIRITWKEINNKENSFILQIKTGGKNDLWEESFEVFEASGTPIWKPVIEQLLLGIEVLGWEDFPQIIKFIFPERNIYIGTGYQDKFFGDGDDILIRLEKDAIKLPDMLNLKKFCSYP